MRLYEKYFTIMCVWMGTSAGLKYGSGNEIYVFPMAIGIVCAISLALIWAGDAVRRTAEDIAETQEA